MSSMWKVGDPYKVVLFYRYVALNKSKEAFIKEFTKNCSELSLKGRILVSEEGINGTLGMYRISF